MAHTIYENFVLENKIEDILTTALDLQGYMTVDTSLTQEPGMKKVIHTYVASGNVEDLAMGKGNTEEITVSFSSAEYEVGTTQGKFQYYDEQEMTDPMVVDTGLDGLAKNLVNDFTAKAMAEYAKGTLEVTGEAWTFELVVDAIAKMNLEVEDGLFLLINPAQQAAFRKALKDDLKYAEDFSRKGYIGTVCGVPVIITKAVPEKEAYLATKDAVTLFIKKGVEVEQERDADHRNNLVYGRKVAVVALTDANKVVKIKVGADEDTGAGDDNTDEPGTGTEPGTGDDTGSGEETGA